MRIVHELIQLDYGGAEKVVKNIIKFDKANKHSIVTYKEGLFRKELEDLGVEIFLLKDKELDMESDVIHIHSGGGISAMGNNLGHRFPVIETIHSPVRSPMPAHLIRQRVGVTNVVSRMNSNCVTIHNGIDVDDLVVDKDPSEVKKELGIKEGIPVIGRLGRLGRDKNLETWLLACYYLQKEGLDFIPLIVGGEAREHKGYRGKLKLMAESLPVKNIVWVGHKSDVANYLNIMDVFLYPSPAEGFGLVFVEAMYMGAVLVTYKNDVTMEVAGGHAILTEQNMPELVKGVKKALDTNIRDEIIPMARNFVISEYAAERMAKEYSELYYNVA